MRADFDTGQIVSALKQIPISRKQPDRQEIYMRYDFIRLEIKGSGMIAVEPDLTGDPVK